MSQKCWKSSNHDGRAYRWSVFFDHRLILIFAVFFIALHVSIGLVLWIVGPNPPVEIIGAAVVAEIWVVGLSLQMCRRAMNWRRRPLTIAYENGSWLLGANKQLVGLERSSLVTSTFCLMIFTEEEKGSTFSRRQTLRLIITPDSIGRSAYGQLLTLCRWNRRIWRY